MLYFVTFWNPWPFSWELSQDYASPCCDRSYMVFHMQSHFVSPALLKHMVLPTEDGVGDDANHGSGTRNTLRRCVRFRPGWKALQRAWSSMRSTPSGGHSGQSSTGDLFEVTSLFLTKLGLEWWWVFARQRPWLQKRTQPFTRNVCVSRSGTLAITSRARRIRPIHSSLAVPRAESWDIVLRICPPSSASPRTPAPPTRHCWQVSWTSSSWDGKTNPILCFVFLFHLGIYSVLFFKNQTSESILPPLPVNSTIQFNFWAVRRLFQGLHGLPACLLRTLVSV